MSVAFIFLTVFWIIGLVSIIRPDFVLRFAGNWNYFVATRVMGLSEDDLRRWPLSQAAKLRDSPHDFVRRKALVRVVGLIFVIVSCLLTFIVYAVNKYGT